MATNWIVVTDSDVKSCFSQVFVDQDSGDAGDPSAKVTTWLPKVIARVRGAILTGNRSGLSLTALSVPPEAQTHVIVLTTEACIIDTPRMVQFVELQPMKDMLNDARQFLKDCANGLSVTAASDLDPTTTPSGTIWGDDQGVGTSATVMTDLTEDGGK